MDIVWQAEDSLREKKVESDLKDLLKTLVAFANSVAPGDTARIFIGEKDDGTVQGVTNPDGIQKRVNKEADEIYPEIYYRTEVYEREGKQCVRVDIKHNGLAPHFGGAAWVRRGSTTQKASDELYQQMVDQRLGKTRVLLQWLNKEVTVQGMEPPEEIPPGEIRRVLAKAEWTAGAHQATLSAVHSHWVTFAVAVPQQASRVDRSEPMEKLLLSWDDKKNRLKILVATTPLRHM